jgi:hypothetical protein
LVIMGADLSGKKELLAISDGVRESMPSVRRTDPGSSRLVTHPGHAVISYTAFASSVKVRDRLMKLSTR